VGYSSTIIDRRREMNGLSPIFGHYGHRSRCAVISTLSLIRAGATCASGIAVVSRAGSSGVCREKSLAECLEPDRGDRAQSCILRLLPSFFLRARAPDVSTREVVPSFKTSIVRGIFTLSSKTITTRLTSLASASSVGWSLGEQRSALEPPSWGGADGLSA